MYSKILEKIKEYDNITIFRHLNADGDAVFSAFGLKQFIKDNFKDKKVKCLGEPSFDLFPKADKANDKFVKNSLAIILDSASDQRIDDERFKSAAFKVVIDHHPGNERTADLSYIETSASATAELLTKIFYSEAFKDLMISKKTAEFLYCGILSDSNNFKTSSTTADTLFYASKIVKDGKLLQSELSDRVFSKSYEMITKTTILRSYLEFKEGVGYMILDKKAMNKIGLTKQQAKNCVDEFASVREFKIWCIFAYDSETKLFDGSLRSKRKYVINNIATRYNGGGHKCACGVKGLTRQEVDCLINELIQAFA